MVVIKKYPNRRLYDTSSGKYVNLEELAAMIRKGVDVQVVDAKTGEDLTRVILTQIIVEDARGGPTGLPLELLRNLVVASDRAGHEFIGWYLKSAIEAYKRVQDAAMSPLNMMKSLLAQPAPVPANDELEQLHRRIAELEARLESPNPRRRKKP